MWSEAGGRSGKRRSLEAAKRPEENYELRVTCDGLAPEEGRVRSTGLSVPGTEAPSLVELMRMSYEEWDVWTRRSAIRRAGYAGFKRNVTVAMGNWSAAEVAAGNWLASADEPPEAAVEALRDAREDPEPLVREHAAWALDRAHRPDTRGSA